MVPAHGAWTRGSRGPRGWGCLERAGRSRRPAAPHPKRPAGPCAAAKVPRPADARASPTCAAAGAELAAPGDVCASPREPSRTVPPAPRSAPAAPPDCAKAAQALAAATRASTVETEAGRWARPPRGLQSLARLRVPRAPAAARVPRRRSHSPKLAAGAAARASAPGTGALGPPTRASGGRRQARAVGGSPSATPGDTRLLLSPPSCPQSPPPQLTGLAHPGPARLSPRQRQLLDRVVAGE